MKSLETILSPIKTALTSVLDNVGHYEAIDGTVTHVIYSEDSEGESNYGDNIKEGQVITGTIDLFWKRGSTNVFDSIQTALNNAEIAFALNSVQTEDDRTGFVHYEWRFEVS